MIVSTYMRIVSTSQASLTCFTAAGFIVNLQETGGPIGAYSMSGSTNSDNRELLFKFLPA
jgi:hypothetical protein